MPECTHNCAGCKESCASRQVTKPAGNPMSRIKRVIGVMSGKGGVGKSLVTSLLASAGNSAGLNTAILDADVTGPSIPRIFGLRENAAVSELGIHPAVTKRGIRVMSINLLMERETDPVLWRGPVISGVVSQFWSDVIWGDTDCLFVDLPPGTGDVPITVFQSLPIDGVVMVLSPQTLVSMIVDKAVNMAKLLNIPILGLVENYSYMICPDCGRRFFPFGEGGLSSAAGETGVPVLARLPIDPALAAACDQGSIEDFEPNYLREAAKALLDL